MLYFSEAASVRSFTVPSGTERRRRDLNPRAAINDLHPFQGCPFGLLGTSPSGLNHQPHYSVIGTRPSRFQRRGWDSNPRALADKRFSRPPRYDHFDTSPGIFHKIKTAAVFGRTFSSVSRREGFPFQEPLRHCFWFFVFLSSAKVIIAKKVYCVNIFFHKF